MADLYDTCFDDHFYKALLKFHTFSEAINAPVRRKGWIRDIFPHGKIVAVVHLDDCKMFVDSKAALIGHTEIRMLPPDEPERSFGNYERGRYGLLTSKAFLLPDPIPFTSRQGKLLDVPTEIVAEIQKQWKAGNGTP